MEYTYEIGLGMANMLGGAYPETFFRHISLILKNGIIHGGPENLRAATMFLCLRSYIEMMMYHKAVRGQYHK